jgi:2-dehydropantoate 2-reductase
VVHPRCVATAAEAGPQDAVIVTLKAHSLPSAAVQMQPLLGPETAIVSAVNGIPWWYFFGIGSAHEGRRVESVDPGGEVSRLLPRSAPSAASSIPPPRSWSPG